MDLGNTNSVITVDTRGDKNWMISAPDDLKQMVDAEADELNMSTAATARYYIQLGRKLGSIHDPRIKRDDSPNNEQTKTEMSPFHKHLPKRDNSITIEEYMEILEKYMYDICEEDENIQRDGREVWLDQ